MSRLRLKRSRKRVAGIALCLCVALFILSLVSLHEYFLVPRSDAIEKDRVAAAGNPALEATLLPLDPDISDPLSPSSPKADHGESQDSENTAGAETNSVSTKCFQVQAGDTVSSILGDYLSPSRIYRLSRQCSDVYSLNRIKTGQEYRLVFQDSALSGFEYDIDSESKLRVRIDEGDLRISKEKIEYETREKLISGRIETNLFDSVEAAGGTASLAISLTEIFAWDIDFIRDVREKDAFSILVSERYRRGDFVGYGRIRAARFVNRGDKFDAFLYETKNGREEYFDGEGRALKKTFLKAPLNFTRISSGYTWKRKHPILDKVRPHLGIDYAAPRGTPIKSVGKGEVIAKGYAKGGGNYLKIRHPNHYVTIYNHMASYAGGIYPGKELEQGQVVGYVGSTGLSTGPHLDYRVKRFGEYRNPRKIESEPVKSVPETEMSAFRRTIQPLRAALDQKGPELAALTKEEAR